MAPAETIAMQAVHLCLVCILLAAHSKNVFLLSYCLEFPFSHAPSILQSLLSSNISYTAFCLLLLHFVPHLFHSSLSSHPSFSLLLSHRSPLPQKVSPSCLHTSIFSCLTFLLFLRHDLSRLVSLLSTLFNALINNINWVIDGWHHSGGERGVPTYRRGLMVPTEDSV